MGISNFFVNEKAILEIIDLRDMSYESTKTIPSSDKKSPDKTINLGNTLTALSSSKTFINSKDQLADALAGVVSGQTSSSGSRHLYGGSVKQFEVQFNPSDLQIDGYGGGRMATVNFSNQDKATKETSGNPTYAEAPVHINFSVKLLFDNMEPNDCFLSAKTNISASELVRSGAKLALSAANKKMTVQQEVEGLVAALRSPCTRLISFNWGDMCYSGVLNRVASQYTMFNASGEPVRAVVQLSLICADQSNAPLTMGAWKKAYENAFGAGKDISLVNGVQKVGSLLNIGI